VLIVEDEELQRKTLLDIMQAEGFEAVGCSSAAEALEYLRRLDVGVVVLDIRLPDISGIELLERLSSYTDRVQFIINTAYSSYDTAKDALNIGAFAYVEKAGDPDELIRCVHRAFRANLGSYADDLETAVSERTGELLEANKSLKQEIAERKRAEEAVLMDREKLKSLASELTLAEERERRRIASEIHDVTIQSLALAKMKLDGLSHSVSLRDPAEVLEEIREALGKAIDETRSLISRVHSPILALLGFEAAVGEWLTGQIQEHGIECQFEDDGEPKPLDDDIKLVLFRNVRELLMNVVKHARAKKVKVSIRRDGEQICVIVEDDGVGFDPAEAASVAHKRDEFGLFSIRERLEEMGGAFEIESAPGRGCRAVMRAPLKCGTQIGGNT